MRTACVVAVAVATVLASLSTATIAGGEPRSHGQSRGRFDSAPHRGPSFHKHGFDRHRGGRRHFGAFGVIVAPPVVVYAAPLLAAAPPAYAAPMYAPPPFVYSAPPIAPPAPPAPPPPPRIVQHPTGRYELQGDGVGTPYTWRWMPNPPPAPPPPPPTAPPAGAPSGPASSGERLPTREQVYRWVDEQGVAHWTNRVDRVPRRYREEAQR